MTVGSFTTYARDFFSLAYPAAWLVRENRLVGLTDFTPPGASADLYPPGIALMTLPETGVSLDLLIRTGLFFLTRDLESPMVQRLGTDREGDMDWHRLIVQGYLVAPRAGEAHLQITKHIALTRPGPGIVTLALYGVTDTINPLLPDFEELRRSLRIAV